MLKKPHKEHWVIEISNLQPKQIDSTKRFLPYAEKYISKLKLKIVGKKSKQFKPYGVSLIYILEESHIAFHTWPEYRYLHIDLFSCVKLKLTAKELKNVSKDIFGSEKISIKQII